MYLLTHLHNHMYIYIYIYISIGLGEFEGLQFESPVGPLNSHTPSFPRDCRADQCEDAFETGFEFCVRLDFSEIDFP